MSRFIAKHKMGGGQEVKTKDDDYGGPINKKAGGNYTGERPAE